MQLQSNLVLDLIKKLSESTPSTSEVSLVEEHKLVSTQNNNAIEEYKEFKELSDSRPGKKLVVLDIDRTIFDYSSTSMRSAARPFLEVFLKGIYDDFDIGIWSATGMDSVIAKLFALGMLENPNYKVLFCMSVDAMILVTVDKKRYRVSKCVAKDWPDNLMVFLFQVKPLQNVWNRYPQYNCQNTIICDDQNVNFHFNRKNGILVAPYSYENHGVDNELLRLLSYLKLIGQCRDLTTFDHEKWRTHGDWDSDSSNEDQKNDNE